MKKIALIAALACGPVFASVITFELTDGSHCTGTCAPGPFGTIEVSTVNSTTVDVLVTLENGAKFVDTGGGHQVLTWSISGDPLIALSGLPVGFVVGPKPDGVPGMGTFMYSVSCPGCGPGASHAKPGPLEFTVAAAGGLTPEMLTANASWYFFTADIIAGNGNTGSVGAYGGTPSIPEPGTWAVGLGLLVGVLMYRRNRPKL